MADSHEYPTSKKSSQISFSSGESAKCRGSESESESVQSVYICICDFLEAITGFKERDVFSSLRSGSFMDFSGDTIDILRLPGDCWIYSTRKGGSWSDLIRWHSSPLSLQWRKFRKE
ncbi:hypothetical protein CK203_084769 [Vitis vinifera]|uniref:Uncharacterized protein n=1 Tax=Vitis vinifera TaxID=29760 RepID=A0A438EKN9_VITVI|nr:hypothetical protein CK203_084769 [Vitis vinifera]